MVLPKKYWRKMMNKKKEKENMISSKKKTTTMDIPHDLIIDIFLRLPPQSLLRFRWLCKSCFNLIRDPTFVNMQLYNISHHNKPNNNNPLVLIYTHNDNQHNLKLNSYNIMDSTCLHSLVSVKGPSVKTYWHSFKILGSCNGLLCIGVGTCVRETYFIWNPCTKEYKTVSDHRNDLCCGNRHRIRYECFNRYGFGYDRTIDDYKLVKTTVNRHNGEHKTCVYVYTLGTDIWKTVRSTYQFILCNTREKGMINGLFISGHLYYTAMKTSSSKTFDLIVSFDIAKEEYRRLPFPNIRKDNQFWPRPVMSLGELKGCLCLLGSCTVQYVHCNPWEVWMMRHNVENNMDVKEEYSWEKLYTIILINSLQGKLFTKLLRFCMNGEILMVMEDGYNYGKKIVLYDPKSGNITVLHEVDFAASVENYIESLVSLNSNTYMS